MDGTSPVLEEQRRQREEAEEEAANNSASDTTTSSQNNNSLLQRNTYWLKYGCRSPNYASINGASTVEFNFPQGIELMQLIKMMAQATYRNLFWAMTLKARSLYLSQTVDGSRSL